MKIPDSHESGIFTIAEVKNLIWLNLSNVAMKYLLTGVL
jgi:hypothetical protein